VSLTQNYGKESLEKYGVGSFRYYGYSDLISLLNRYFDVFSFFSTDSITNQQDAVFFCKKFLKFMLLVREQHE